MSDIVFLGICAGCLGEAKDASIEALSNALDTANLTSVVSLNTPECFNACGLPSTVTLQSKGRATYIFRDVVIARDIVDIIKTIEAYIAAPLGWIEDARVCGHLRTCLMARLPAIDL
jgi:predicted metal-binding protein